MLFHKPNSLLKPRDSEPAAWSGTWESAYFTSSSGDQGRRLQSPAYRRYEYVGSIGRIAKRTEKGNLCSGMCYLEEKGVFFEVSFLANSHVSWSETEGVWKCKKEQKQWLSHRIWRKNFALCLNIWHNWDRVWHKVI